MFMSAVEPHCGSSTDNELHGYEMCLDQSTNSVCWIDEISEFFLRNREKNIVILPQFHVC